MSDGTTSSLSIVKRETPRPLGTARVCVSCGGTGRLMISTGEGSYIHLNMAECGREEK
jgi:hypothetical protein